MKFYFDEHIPKAVAEGLRRRGIDVLTVREAERVGDPDRKQLTFAAMKRRILVTLLSLITEEEKQDVDSGCGFNSLIYRETRTDAGKALNM